MDIDDVAVQEQDDEERALGLPLTQTALP